MNIRHMLTGIAVIAGLVVPALAAEWTTYHNARYGATADIPPSYSPTGPEAANSDGLIFRSTDGSLLTIYGAPIPNRDLAAFVANAIAHDQSYNGWPVQGQTVTPDWAEYWGGRRGQVLKVRIEATCNGTIAIVAKFEANGGSQRDMDRVFNSLTAGSARAC